MVENTVLTEEKLNEIVAKYRTTDIQGFAVNPRDFHHIKNLLISNLPSNHYLPICTWNQFEIHPSDWVPQGRVIPLLRLKIDINIKRR